MGRQLVITGLLLSILNSGTTPAVAQNVQNWLQNQAGRIQQSYGSGMINQSQAGQLQNREAQIVSQEQRYMQQNGGQLTPQQSQQIGSEIRRLNRHMMGDINKNNPSLSNGMYSYRGGWPGGAWNQYGGQYPGSQYGQGWPNQYNYPNWYQNNPAAFQQLSPQQQSAFYRYYRRHYQ